LGEVDQSLRLLLRSQYQQQLTPGGIRELLLSATEHTAWNDKRK